MRVGIIQSSYLPWRGYFDFIDSVDVFIVYDTVQFSKGSWRNRNRLKTRDGCRWITVPVRHVSLSQRIADTLVDDNRPWRQSHRDQFRESYRLAPHYEFARDLIEEVACCDDDNLSRINVRLMKMAMQMLSIRTPLVDAGDLAADGTATERVVRMVEAVGGTCYLSGPAAESYLDLSVFQAAGVALEYKRYDYRPYPQLWGEFTGEVSILDLLANVGSDASQYIKSRSPDTSAA